MVKIGTIETFWNFEIQLKGKTNLQATIRETDFL